MQPLDRRTFLAAAVPPAAVVLVPGRAAAALAEALALPAAAAAPEDSARDEDFWRPIQQAFTVDRSIVNLNNGGVSPAPSFVQDALARHLAHANSAPSSQVLLEQRPPQIEAVRARLAHTFGADPEEIAITRNASESLQICQQGIDLARGDEVLTSTQDYPRMITTFKQRERREGIVLKQVELPVPAEDPAEVVARFAAAITPQTRLMLVSHVINLTAQILPVKELAALGRARGIPVIVDGAHALAHLDFAIRDLECDYYGVSLHKWLFAPHGTGLLYVRRDKIQGLWPLMAAEAAEDGDIRKFEQIGTHPLANYLAIAEALDFHDGLGAARKLARMVYLRDYWAERLLANPRVTLNTSQKPGAGGGFANVRVEGFDPRDLQAWLWAAHRIFTTPIVHAECPGLRISPSVYTTLGELDRFCAAVELALAHGIGK